ncbi:MAG: YitT family protein [Peptococcaceae bacterium]|nr:YitT family protein [Peptococcaceae bacterium]
MKTREFGTKRLLQFALVLLGNSIYALSVKLFLLPANLISCGTTGMALVVNALTGMPISYFIFCFCIFINRNFVNTLYVSISNSTLFQVFNLLFDLCRIFHIKPFFIYHVNLLNRIRGDSIAPQKNSNYSTV